MRFVLICLSILFRFFFYIYGQFVRNDNESAEMFASRIKPDSTVIAHSVFETNQLDASKNV